MPQIGKLLRLHTVPLRGIFPANMENVYDVLKERGFVSQVTEEGELKKILGSSPIACYIGFDPTAPSLHAGSLLPLMALSHMQRAGHRPIAILGGGTAMVGDPSGKTEMRKMLTEEQIRQNGECLKKQFSRFVDFDGNRALMINNADWLLGLNYISFLREIGRHFSVNRMLTHESYKIRLEKGLSFLEFNYQLLQAYDFLVLFQKHNCVLQMGGDDQWGNIVAGMDLIRRMEGKQAFGLTFPLLTTAAGEKMGKTAKGAVWLDAETTSPYEFYQYFRNTDDRDVGRFLRYFTYLSLSEVRRLESLQGSQINEAKEVLAFEVTRIVHGEEAAEAARRGAKGAFSGAAQGMEDVPSSAIPRERLVLGILVVDLLVEIGLCDSKSAARRLVEQGGARAGEKRVSGITEKVFLDDLSDGSLLVRAGKKKVHRIVAE
jgi:tyrosyl-tRNA synthetase